LEEEIFEQELDIPADAAGQILGVYDANIKKIESAFSVSFSNRNGTYKLSGSKRCVQASMRVINDMLDLVKKGEEVTDQSLDYAIQLSVQDSHVNVAGLRSDVICHTVLGKPVAPKTIGQKNYVENIRKKMITFGVGPAGTGKTYLAIALAVTCFKEEEVGRIILTRPAIEAGEKLGFLPGDLQQKIDPYLRPLYDALYQIMGAESYQKNVEKGLIEVAPLAYMRGRTLDNSFIILDEAQNTTPAQMKMFLTRIGFGSKVVVTGDLSQKDLPDGQRSGLDNALAVLKDINDIGVTRLSSADVVRHPLVQKIVDAYDRYEKKHDKSSRPYGRDHALVPKRNSGQRRK
jgi:phosphate starvation-inducible PhoH-like protein